MPFPMMFVSIRGVYAFSGDTMVLCFPTVFPIALVIVQQPQTLKKNSGLRIKVLMMSPL